MQYYTQIQIVVTSTLIFRDSLGQHLLSNYKKIYIEQDEMIGSSYSLWNHQYLFLSTCQLILGLQIPRLKEFILATK